MNTCANCGIGIPAPSGGPMAKAMPSHCGFCQAVIEANYAPKPLRVRPVGQPPRLEPITYLEPCSGCGHEIVVSQPREPGVVRLCAQCEEARRSHGYFDHNWGAQEAAARIARGEWKRAQCQRCQMWMPRLKAYCGTCEREMSAIAEMDTQHSAALSIPDEATPETQVTRPVLYTDDEWARLNALDGYYSERPGLWDREEVRYNAPERTYNLKDDVVEALDRAFRDGGAR